MVEAAEDRLGFARNAPEAEKAPLVPTRRSAWHVVKKADLVAAARADASRLRDQAGNPLQLLGPGGGALGGHFMRRSGAKALARAGEPLASIQHAGRWGSMAVLAYVEEAREDCLPARIIPSPKPPAPRQWPDVKIMILDVLRESAQVHASEDDFINIIMAPEAGKVRKDVCGAIGDRDAIARLEGMVRELADVVFPHFVLSRDGSSRRVAQCAHLCEQFRGTPSSWTTLCGWRWVSSTRGCSQSARLPADATVCKRCSELAEGSPLARLLSPSGGSEA